MDIYPIKAYTDNYIWCLEGEKIRVYIDPGESIPVLEDLRGKEDKATLIFLTHKHEDHVGGVKALRSRVKDLRVFGPGETQDLVDQVLREGDQLDLDGETLKVLEVPGHTEGHLAYQLGRHLFTGDALFMAGCGRVFTGDYRAQYESLERFKALDDQTLVYPGHEYTLGNLEFAREVFPDKEDIQRVLEEVKSLRRQNKPSLPSTIGQEKKINPFFFAKDFDDFVRLRRLKDQS